MISKTAAVLSSLLLAAALSPAYAAGTHLMQPSIDSHVVLTDDYILGGSKICLSGAFSDRAFFRVFPDGTMSSEPFTVPRDQKLVITDVEWASGPDGADSMLPGHTIRLDIFLFSSASTFARVFASRSITLDPHTATGIPGTSEQLTAGFVVGPGVTICPSVYQRTPSHFLSSFVDFIVLRGYLVPDATR